MMFVWVSGGGVGGRVACIAFMHVDASRCGCSLE